MTILCELFELSRAGYYAWHEAHETARSQRDQELAPLVRSIFLQHRRRYGARRIAVELAAMGQLCGVERVAKLLKSQGLQAIQPRAYRPRTTDSRHTLGYSPNLLLSASSPVTINRVWVADITYIPLRTAGFAYLALVMDRFSRRVVGWQFEVLGILWTVHLLSWGLPQGLFHASDQTPDKAQSSPSLLG